MNVWRVRDRVVDLGARPWILGIINATPDSFSDGGQFFRTEQAVQHGLRLIEEGADILDIGGESTRPGSLPVSEQEELDRVLPVVEALAGKTGTLLSLDTTKSAVARAGLHAGAHIINDVSALTFDPEMAKVAREYRAGVILMHMQGTPATMQDNPRYDEVVKDIGEYLEQRIETLVGQGLERETLSIDPGIGFGKTVEHNLEILRRLDEFRRLDRPICLGVSRKGFLGKFLGRKLADRTAAGLGVLAHALSRGAVDLIRVHDVAPTRDLIQMWVTLEGDRVARPTGTDVRSDRHP